MATNPKRMMIAAALVGGMLLTPPWSKAQEDPGCAPMSAGGETFSVPVDLGEPIGVVCVAFVGFADVIIGGEEYLDVHVSTLVLGEPRPAGRGMLHATTSHTFDFGEVGSFTTVDKAKLLPMRNEPGAFRLISNLVIESGTGAFADAAGRMGAVRGQIVLPSGPPECSGGTAVWEGRGSICFDEPEASGNADEEWTPLDSEPKRTVQQRSSNLRSARPVRD